MPSFTTQKHDEIRAWIEERGGHPASVSATKESDDPGLLRVCFPEPGLERISWEEFFQKFDEEQLAFLCQEDTEGGETSRFCRFVKAKEAAASQK